MARISDSQARTIACDWHGGQYSPLYALGSSGAIRTEDVRREIAFCLSRMPVGRERRPLLALDRYVREIGTRGPVEGWHLGWDEEEPTLEQC